MDDTIYAIGYSYKSVLHPENSVEEAFRNLRVNLSLFREFQAEAQWEFIQKGYETALVGGGYREFFDDTIAPGEIEVVDTQITGDMCVLLGKVYCPSAKSGAVITRKWWEELPDDKDFIYAVGASPMYYHEESSWLMAERDARANLAFSIVFNIESSIKRDYRGIEKVVREKVKDVTLRCVQLVAREIVPVSGSEICYVLLRMPKDAVMNNPGR